MRAGWQLPPAWPKGPYVPTRFGRAKPLGLNPAYTRFGRGRGPIAKQPLAQPAKRAAATSPQQAPASKLWYRAREKQYTTCVCEGPTARMCCRRATAPPSRRVSTCRCMSVRMYVCTCGTVSIYGASVKRCDGVATASTDEQRGGGGAWQ